MKLTYLPKMLGNSLLNKLKKKSTFCCTLKNIVLYILKTTPCAHKLLMAYLWSNGDYHLLIFNMCLLLPDEFSLHSQFLENGFF